MARNIWVIRQFGETYYVRPFPSRPFRATKVYRCDDGQIVAVNAKGHFFSTDVQGRQRFYSGIDGKTLSILEGLAGLGVLPADKVKAVQAEREKRKVFDCKAFDAEQVRDYADSLKLPLTKRQRETLAAHIKAGS